MSVATVGEQLAAISVKLDLLLAGKDDHEARIRVLEAVPYVDPARVTALERFHWKQLGAMGAVSFMGGGLGAALIKFLA